MQEGGTPKTYHDGPDRWYRLRGRISRRRFWLNYQLTALGLYALLLGLAILGREVGTVVALVLAIPVTWLGTAGTVKRLHDHGWSGWAYVGLLVLGGIGDGIHPTLGAIVTCVLFIMTGLRRGERGANRFGPDPLAAARAPVAPDRQAPPDAALSP